MSLRPLFLLGGARRREQQPVLVQPGEAALLAQVGELAHGAVLIEPEAFFVAVVLLVCIGDDEGRPLPAGGVTDVGEEEIVQDIAQFHRLHGVPPVFLFCRHYTAAGKGLSIRTLRAKNHRSEDLWFFALSLGDQPLVAPPVMPST